MLELKLYYNVCYWDTLFCTYRNGHKINVVGQMI